MNHESRRVTKWIGGPIESRRLGGGTLTNVYVFHMKKRAFKRNLVT
jgi:hypothetical protein